MKFFIMLVMSFFMSGYAMAGTVVDNLGNTANEVLKYALDSAKAVGEVAKTEVPLYFKEYVTFMAIDSAIRLTVFLLMIIVGIVVMVLNRKKDIVAYDGPSRYFFLHAGAAALILFGSIGSLQHGTDLAKAIYAPRVLVIEKLSNLVK